MKTFKENLLTVLESYSSYEQLLKSVRDTLPVSLQKHDLYEVLQELWSEFGFDDRSDGGELQDKLEFLMERVWFECPPSETARR